MSPEMLTDFHVVTAESYTNKTVLLPELLAQCRLADDGEGVVALLNQALRVSAVLGRGRVCPCERQGGEDSLQTGWPFSSVAVVTVAVALDSAARVSRRDEQGSRQPRLEASNTISGLHKSSNSVLFQQSGPISDG